MNYCGLILTTLCAGTLWAETIPVANHSFEQTELGVDGKQVSTEVPGWKLSGKAGVFVNLGTYGNEMTGADGTQMAFLNGTQEGGFTQDVLRQIQPSTIYTLSVSVGLREDTPLAKGSSLLLRLQAYDTNTGNFMRTLGLKEILVGTDPLSDAHLTNFTASFTATPSKGGLRINIAVGEKDGD